MCRVSKNACGGSTTGSHNISRLHEAIPEGVHAGGEEQRWRGQVDVSANRAGPPSSTMMPMSLKHKMKIAFRASRRLRHPTVAGRKFFQDKSCSKHMLWAKGGAPSPGWARKKQRATHKSKTLTPRILTINLENPGGLYVPDCGRSRIHNL